MSEIFLDEVDGTKEFLSVDEITGESYIRRETDVESVVDRNKAIKSHNPKGMGNTKEWQHVAEIPLSFIREYQWKWGIDLMAKENEAVLTRILNDPDYKHFRVNEGKV